MIRQAISADIPSIERLGRDMHAESRYAIYPYSSDKYTKIIHHCVNNGIAIVYDDVEIKGVLLAVIQTPFFGDFLQSTDFVQYVIPDIRGGLVGVRLIKAYIDEAKWRGVSDICIGNSSGINTERTGKLYQKLGFELNGANYSLGDGNV